MKQYHDLLKLILGNGDVTFEPRTQQYTIGLSGAFSVYDLREGFPLMTTKNVAPRWPFEELFWKLRGERNIRSLSSKGIDIWDANAFDRHLRTENMGKDFPKNTVQWNSEFSKYKKRISEDSDFAQTAGDLGPVYGFQWRHGFKKGEQKIDQLVDLIEGIKRNPGSRYHVLNAWNPSDLKEMALGPCPFWHQFTVYGNQMDLTMVQRSCDVFLGVPFNIAQDALLLHMVAKETKHKPRFFKHMLVNVHAYLGVPPRANFWTEDKNVDEFQERFRYACLEGQDKFLGVKEWYLSRAVSESLGNERKDHIPFILEQLNYLPKSLPKVEIVEGSIFDLIQRPAREVIKVEDYDPHRWDSKAVMAA